MPHCNKQTGGRVVKPSEYYGGSSGRYFPSGSPSLTPCNSAYGATNAVSFGKINDDYTSSGPNLGPYPGSSGKMTGGKRKNRRKNRSNSNSNKNKKNKSHRKNNKNRNSRTKKRSLKNRKTNSSNNNNGNKNKKNKKRTQKK
tara:strand:+ start:115 stop:540 length:426 start_codon:yes stop_codon:yes gene_type:complete